MSVRERTQIQGVLSWLTRLEANPTCQGSKRGSRLLLHSDG